MLNKIYYYQYGRAFSEKPTVVIDRGGDRGILIKHLTKLNQPFLIRLKGRYLHDYENKEALIKIGNRELNFLDLPYQGSTKRVESSNKTSEFRYRFDFKKVGIKAIEDNKPYFLVTVWGENSKSPMELMTNEKIGTLENAMEIIIFYLSRWSIEEMYKYLKLNGLEKVRALNYLAIKNLISLAFLASIFVTSQIKYETNFLNVVEKTIKAFKKGTLDLFNWHRRATQACRILLKRLIDLGSLKDGHSLPLHHLKP